MTKWLTSGKIRELSLRLAAGPALLLASLANFLSHNGYPFFRGEVALVALGLIAVGAVLAPFYVGQRQWGRSVLEGVLAALFIDLNADSLVLAIASGLGVGLLTWWWRLSLAGPMAVFGFAILLTTIIGFGRSPNWIKEERGAERGVSASAQQKLAIVHLILDEHVGLVGSSDEGIEGQRLRNDLRDFYAESGFALYGRAYTRHFNTGNAIPEILNYGKGLARKASKKDVETGPTKHLQSFVDQGYRLTIFQSEYVDFCAGAIFHDCITYDSSSLRPTLAAPLDTMSRAGLLTSKFMTLSDFLKTATGLWNFVAVLTRGPGHSPLVFTPNLARSSSVATLEVLDKLAGRLSSLRPGEAVFAHLLLPHYPYTVRADCSYLPWFEWDDLYSDSTIQQRRRAYYNQVRCTTRKIGELLRALSGSPAGANTVVIIHGDHGSRITRINPNEANLGRFREPDMVAGFSTLFVVRAPGIEGGYFGDPETVSALLHDFTTSGFRSAPNPTQQQRPTVYLADSEWKPVRRVPLPSSWTEVR